MSFDVFFQGSVAGESDELSHGFPLGIQGSAFSLVAASPQATGHPPDQADKQKNLADDEGGGTK